MPFFCKVNKCNYTYKKSLEMLQIPFLFMSFLLGILFLSNCKQPQPPLTFAGKNWQLTKQTTNQN